MFNKYVARHIIVALDFDGTIADLTEARIKATYAVSGMKVNRNQISKHTSPLDRKQYKDMTTLAGTQEYMDKYYTLLPYVKETLHALYNQSFRFAIITSRPDEIYPPVKRFIDKHHLPIKYVHNTSYSPKSYITKKLKARIVLDDSLEKLIELKHTSAHLAYLNDKRTSDPKITTVRNWKEFYTYCIQVKQLHEEICRKNDWRNNIWNFSKIANYINH
ncbi:MAG: HAD hydrolase-like protein [Candidatus Woesearchaeota archaeon]